MEKLETLQQMAHHNHWTNTIRKTLAANYCAWEREKNIYHLCINLSDVGGKKRNLRIPVVGTPADVTSEKYLELISKFQADGKA